MNLSRLSTAIFWATISTAGVAGSTTYSLDSLLSSGYHTSNDLKSVEEEQKKTDAQVTENYGKALPTIDFSTNLSHAFLEESTAPVTPQTPKENSLSYGLTLKQPLFAQGKVSIGLRIAKIYQRSLLCKWQETKMTVRSTITKAYYAALFAQKTATIKESAVKLAEESHKVAIAKFNAGKSAELDTLNSYIYLETAKIDLSDAQASARNAKDLLCKSSGITQNPDSVTIAGDFPDESFAIPLNDALTRTTTDNKKITQLNATKEIQKEMVKLAKSDYLPTVFCGGTLGQAGSFTPVDNITWKDNKSIFVGASWNIFNGFQTSQKVIEAKCDERSVEESFKKLTDGLSVQTRASWETMESSRKKLEQSRRNLVVMEKTYEITQKAYDVGSRTILDLQQTQQNLNGVRLAVNAAQFSLISAAIDLRVLMGDFVQN